MFSSLWSKGGKNNTNDNNNNLQKSIFEDDDDPNPTTYSPTSSVIPTPAHYPLHASVLQKDGKSLLKHIQDLPATNPLLPDKMKPINQRDHHGYTALHLCVYLAWEQGIDILLQNGASPTVRRYAIMSLCNMFIEHQTLNIIL